MPHDQIVASLDARGVEFEIAIENTLRDFNMGTIVRSANAFGVRTVHIIGRRQWNRRGAMMTEAYLTLRHHENPEQFAGAMHDEKRTIVGVDNVANAIPLAKKSLSDRRAVLVFGQEGPGLSSELLAVCNYVVEIEQRGSTRSLNVGVAAGIVMYELLRHHYLQNPPN